MRSYFFHIVFELYTPAALKSTPSLAEFAKEAETQLQSGSFFLPSRGFNIFNTKELPDHTLRAPSPKGLKKSTQREKARKEGQATGTETEKAKQENPIPRRAFVKGRRHIDFRFGKVSIESFDIIPKSQAEGASSASAGSNMTSQIQPINSPPKLTALSFSAAASSTPTNSTISAPLSNKQPSRNRIGAVTSPPRARFVALNPKFTEFGYGVVHLYRDGEQTQEIYPIPEEYPAINGDTKSPSNEETTKPMPSGKCENTDEEAFKTVAILAVPSYMTASDFMGFVGEETRENASHFRMIKTGQANRYMVLIRFRQADKARDFVQLFNGKVFNSMEPENCHVVFIKSIQFISSTNLTSASPENFPGNMLNDPFSPVLIPPAGGSLGTATTISTKPAPPPTPSLLELPTCPVCLERMDETTGLLTILCQHVFHCACLSKWKDSSCPVCRYSQAGVVGRASGAADGDDCEEFCNVCGADSNLWICLICGHIGCGRYDEAHAFQHYQETAHTYAMDVDTQRVWDYAGDGYVHRLIQNKSDGKLVELPSALSSTGHSNPANGDYVPREKLDKIGMEYTYLLTSQLDSQRTYYEEKVAQAADKAACALKDAERWNTIADDLQAELRVIKAQHQMIVNDTLPQLTKDKDRAERKAEKFADMAKRLEKEWNEEKSMNSSLIEKVEYLTKQSEERKKESEELKEQLRDLMFFLDAREKLKESGNDVQEGTVTVAEAPEKKAGKKKKGKGKR